MAGQANTIMAFMQFSDGTVTVGQNSSLQSGFKGTLGDGSVNTTGVDLPNKKYYDLYQFSSNVNNTSFNRRILGDATGEMGPFANATYLTQIRQISSWYADLARFINFNNPWFIRGGDHSYALDAGMFAFENDYGRMTTWFGFRVVLMPN